MLMNVTAHVGCANTVRESALKVDSGRKITCRTWESNPRLYYTMLLCQLNYTALVLWLQSEAWTSKGL